MQSESYYVELICETALTITRQEQQRDKEKGVKAGIGASSFWAYHSIFHLLSRRVTQGFNPVPYTSPICLLAIAFRLNCP